MTITMRDIEMAVCARFNLGRDELKQHTRSRRIVRPRQIAMYLAREMTNLSYPRIGRYFDRDHTTALHANRRITQMIGDNEYVAAYVIECRALVRPRSKEMDRELAKQPLVVRL